MKAFLMHPDRDFELDAAPPPAAEDVTQDLGLETVLATMSGGDELLWQVARAGLLATVAEPEEIRYRQEILRDCLAHPDVVSAIYELAAEAIAAERRARWAIASRSPDLILYEAREVLAMSVEHLRRLRRIADDHGAAFRSAGFGRLFADLQRELSDEYFATVEGHLRELRFRGGALISADLGAGLKGRGYVLRRPTRKRSWRDRLPLGSRDLTYQVPDRDEAGGRALRELRGRGINRAANALAQSSDHILSYFQMLRAELGFYVGCLNLHRALTGRGEPTCFPEPLAAGARALRFRGLYDVALSLAKGERVVGNDIDADGRSLVMITGANQGGKSTFLRSVGLAQLMMQAGMFVGAESFRAEVRTGLFTHFKREEDPTMRQGKLDEELGRMSAIVDQLDGRSLVLCNESFAATNEREGSEIARQIVRALLDSGVKVVFVTHLYDLAHGLYAEGRDDALFLRAERRADGQRTFRMVAGEPEETSYGADLYRRIFGASEEAPARVPETIAAR